MDNFKAFMVNKNEQDFSAEVKTIQLEDLPEGDVLIKVAYSSVNFKDGLASIPNGKIVRSYPFIPGIDLAGTVVRSDDSRFNEGDEVIATSYEIGVSHYGGYSEYARIPGDWIVPLPEGLTLKEAMVFGTAGFTAALSVHRLEENGLTPEKGKVLVTGASGGVGSVAVAMLAKRGYHVVASTGKESEHEYLRKIGATDIISREELVGEKIKPLDKQLWAAAVDPVGGKTLSAILSKLEYNGSVAVSGLTGGTDVPATVFPFILRGINLLGIDSVYCPMETRKLLWQRMATDLKPEGLLETIKNEVSLEELPGVLTSILKGENRGRTIVKM
ncbi:acryloyl-CoA reductase [Mesobacillus sp. AQ2]|uniref:NADPH:quinone oxidoreductase family protein n=1 Tax=unclassified Mesobacillus TaxID=2675270 RepID=UPI0020425930|nr:MULTISPECIES: acryloyl-CoA reductase [unclassified Mesobacillus]MCM3124600.1 acryloyl-CoA reductase [Mesobacillus sp. MER 33]MCM3234690.1 acryloyl-CoA reductase [Mesobacillus sp. MER 48]WHX41623.1 acryloyl-CoA reductase [Mesobacillus sp. AQ2]